MNNCCEKKHPIKRLIATFFYSGLIKPAPGTWGTLATALFALLTIPLVPVEYAQFYCIGLTILFFVIGLIAVPSILTKENKDPSFVVIDEAAGLMLAISIYPATLLSDSLLPIIITTTIFFRFFDILKPFPVRQFEKIPGAMGVMMDDIIAGALAGITSCIFIN